MSFDYDAVVIGGGSAGYAAARTLAAGGARTALVESGPELGGLCILRGCMPTKALLHAAELRHAFREAARWGITADNVRVDLAKLFARKDELIADFAGYLQADAYAPYEKMSAPQNGAPSKIIHVACMAHARRHFFEAFEKSQSPIAKESLLRI